MRSIMSNNNSTSDAGKHTPEKGLTTNRDSKLADDGELQQMANICRFIMEVL
jgi:hypothetical protein